MPCVATQTAERWPVTRGAAGKRNARAAPSGGAAELGFRDAPLPVPRLATAVHDRNDENEFRFDGVQHAVGKHAREAAPKEKR